jgi:hypothetical protein
LAFLIGPWDLGFLITLAFALAFSVQNVQFSTEMDLFVVRKWGEGKICHFSVFCDLGFSWLS